MRVLHFCQQPAETKIHKHALVRTHIHTCTSGKPQPAAIEPQLDLILHIAHPFHTLLIQSRSLYAYTLD